MEIVIVAEGAKRKLASGATQSYPVNWSGDVPDADARRFIEEGRAQPATGAISDFSADEKLALKVLAQHTLQAAADAVSSGENDAGDDANDEGDDATVKAAGGDEEQGEVEPDPDGQDPADVIRALSKEDLHALAKSRNVRFVARSRADIEADLIAQIAAAE